MRINRFLDTPFIDEHRLNLHYKFYKMRNISLYHKDEDEEKRYQMTTVYYATKLAELIRDEDPMYIPPNFAEILENRIEEIERAILHILHYEFSNGEDSTEFDQLDNIKKVQYFINKTNKDPDDKRCFVDYQQNKNIILLLEAFYHFQYSEELELLEEYVPQGELC